MKRSRRRASTRIRRPGSNLRLPSSSDSVSPAEAARLARAMPAMASASSSLRSTFECSLHSASIRACSSLRPISTVFVFIRAPSVNKRASGSAAVARHESSELRPSRLGRTGGHYRQTFGPVLQVFRRLPPSSPLALRTVHTTSGTFFIKLPSAVRSSVLSCK